jgi:hypothetical protein
MRHFDPDSRFAMPVNWPHSRCVILAILVTGLLGSQARGEETSFTVETLRGRAVFFAEAFEKQTGVPVVTEARERILALQTNRQELVPLLEDVRGRAFRVDERLRKMEVELLVRRYRGSPMAQILRLIEIGQDGRYEIDYWCEVCSIAMFERKDCECCQEPTILRRQKVE